VNDPHRSTGADPAHVDLILEEIDALPTLSPVAVRALRLTGSSDADVRAIIELVESDPALAAKILSLCRKSNASTAHRVESVERAVIHLGLQAVRCALLSVEVFGIFGVEPNDHEPGGIDRRGFWIHSIAVAAAAELITEQAHHRGQHTSTTPPEAFLCGLLHDLGKLALQVVLPKAYARVVETAERRRCALSDAERELLGIDHHAAGRRLAERWGLPHIVQDTMWLHGSPPHALPALPHAELVRTVTAADALARAHRLGWSGSHERLSHLSELLAGCHLDPEDDLGEELVRRVMSRSRALGLAEDDDPDLLVRWIAQANRELGRISTTLARHAREASTARSALEQISQSLTRTTRAAGVREAILDVANSLEQLAGGSPRVAIWQPRRGAPWTVYRCETPGSIHHAGAMPIGERPDQAPADLADLFAAPTLTTRTAEALERLAELLKERPPIDGLSVFPLTMEHGPAAVLLHDRSPQPCPLDEPPVRQALSAAWAALLAHAARHENATRLTEEVASAGRQAAAESDQRAQTRASDALAEIAAGAAHEMNNPLTVISGKSQLLMAKLETPQLQSAARSIVAACDRLSELVTSIHLFAKPPVIDRSETSLKEIVDRAVGAARGRLVSENPKLKDVRITVTVPEKTRKLYADLAQLALVLTELILNAAQAEPITGIEVRADVHDAEGRILLVVEDDGHGMSPHTLAHATQPFFSSKPAGRRTGLGLARVTRLVEAHGGEFGLSSARGRGTEALIVLPRTAWEEGREQRPAA
jgi:signal transduction histidine kinase/HD-like signal output (HDOD) protein